MRHAQGDGKPTSLARPLEHAMMDHLYPPEQFKSKSPSLTCSRERPPQPSTYLQPAAAHHPYLQRLTVLPWMDSLIEMAPSPEVILQGPQPVSIHPWPGLV